MTASTIPIPPGLIVVSPLSFVADEGAKDPSVAVAAIVQLRELAIAKRVAVLLVVEAGAALDPPFVPGVPVVSSASSPTHASVRDAVVSAPDIAFKLEPTTRGDASAFGLTPDDGNLASHASLRQRLSRGVGVCATAHDLMSHVRVMDGHMNRGWTHLPLPWTPPPCRRTGAHAGS